MKAQSIWGAAGAAAGGFLLFAGLALAQTTPALKVGINVSPQITPGTRSTIALINFDASQSSSSIRIPSLGITGTFAGGAGLSSLRNCSIASIASIGTALNTGNNSVSTFGNSNTFTFDTGLMVPAGNISNLALVCDVDPAATVGSSISLGITPSTISATDQSSSTVIVPTANTGANGSSQINGTATIASASTGTGSTGTGSGTTGSSGITVTPGAPNTGAGGWSVTNIILLILAAVVVIGGGAMLMQKPRA